MGMIELTNRSYDMEVPTCAKLGHRGTVVVRLREDKCLTCQRHTCLRKCTKDNSDIFTRIYYYYKSDCDNVLLDKQRPFRASRARSRFVNVCATVCLLLLLGTHPELSTAAPHHQNRIMERERRNSNGTEENEYWRNPCGYKDTQTNIPYSPDLALQAANHALLTLKEATMYKDRFADQLHSYRSFKLLLTKWDNHHWFRERPWFQDYLLPENKVFGQEVSAKYMDELMNNLKDSGKQKEILPVMYKGLKIFVAAFYHMHRNGISNDDYHLEDLKEDLKRTSDNMKMVLCLFYDVITTKQLEVHTIDEAEIPDFSNNNTKDMLLVYRDSLNYLEYMAQVFRRMYETNA